VSLTQPAKGGAIPSFAIPAPLLARKTDPETQQLSNTFYLSVFYVFIFPKTLTPLQIVHLPPRAFFLFFP